MGSIIGECCENLTQNSCEEEDFAWIGGLKRLSEILSISESDFINAEDYESLNLANW